jgi:hypothetical protein
VSYHTVRSSGGEMAIEIENIVANSMVIKARAGKCEVIPRWFSLVLLS